jgi:hypothetical protein
MSDSTKIFKKRKKEIEFTLIFLKMTREGDFAPVDLNAISDERQDYSVTECQEELYYYSIS